MATQIRVRRDSAADWTSTNPTLALGELGVETDTRKMKIGDGATAWTGLDYITTSAALDDLTDVDVAGIAAGSILYWNGTDFVDLGIGAADEVLTVNAGATAPEWAAAGGSGTSFAPQSAVVATLETTTSTSPTDLATAGPAKTVTVGASGEAIVILTCRSRVNSIDQNSFMGVALSGATTAAATAARSLEQTSSTTNAAVRASRWLHLTGLTPGSTTFTAKYWLASTGTASFEDRNITVIPI